MKFLLLVVLMFCTVVFADSEKAHLEYLHTKSGTLIKIVNDSPRSLRCFVKVEGERKRWYEIKRHSYTLWMDEPRTVWGWECL